MRTLTKEMQSSLTPKQALELLKEGNKRFVNNLKIHRNLLEQVNETSDEQHPFAVILSCIDSRTSVELIFDQGLGDVFSIRIAGNIINEDILGSMEFSVKVVGVKIIVVIGHTKCGAIKGAISHVEMGNLTALLNKIEPAIYSEHITTQNRDANNEEFVNSVAEINTKRSVLAILERSTILKEAISTGKCAIIAGLHDIATGEVRFFDGTFIDNT